MHGYFRDDAPLRAHILDEDERDELDRLWAELDFITFSPERPLLTLCQQMEILAVGFG